MRPLTRREFLRESFGLLISASILKHFQFSTGESFPNLVIARNGTPQKLIKAGLDTIGGIKTVVKTGQNVVIKVNMSWNADPSQVATTNPDLVHALVQECVNAGASNVLVLDHTIDNGEMCLDRTQMEEKVKQAGGKIKAINSERDYREVNIPGKELKKALVSRDVLDADVFINVPIAKVHNSAGTTLSMKNLMGIVWDRKEFHWRGLDQCIADLSSLVKPDLIVLDAYKILMTRGPRGPGTVKETGEVVLGADPVAVDVYGTMLLEKDPCGIEYITNAAELGIGQPDIEKINTVYVDAQKTVSGEPPAEPTPAETQPPESQPPEPTEPKSEEPVQLTPAETQPPEPEKEKEKEVGIPFILVIPVMIISLLIGLRMRNQNQNKE
ncbi:MAG: DUF362 domain-containing protein [Candidatus Methanofastidiosia archaeon]